MKKVKILAIFLTVLVFLGTYNVLRVDAAVYPYVKRNDCACYWNNDYRENIPVPKSGEGTIWTEDMAQRVKNLYCAQYGISRPDWTTYWWSKKVVIEGNVATFADGTKVEHKDNNIIAAILTEGAWGRKSFVRNKEDTWSVRI